MNKLMRDVFDAIQLEQKQKQEDVNLDSNTDDLIDVDPLETPFGYGVLSFAFIFLVFVLCLIGDR